MNREMTINVPWYTFDEKKPVIYSSITLLTKTGYLYHATVKDDGSLFIECDLFGWDSVKIWTYSFHIDDAIEDELCKHDEDKK